MTTKFYTKKSLNIYLEKVLKKLVVRRKKFAPGGYVYLYKFFVPFKNEKEKILLRRA